jgi:hypothetical protein
LIRDYIDEKKAFMDWFSSCIVFTVSLGIILFELTLTRIFSTLLWYDYAFMAISVAIFGPGIGAFAVYIFKTRKKAPKGKEEKGEKGEKNSENLISLQIYQYCLVLAVSLPIFLFIVGYIIPSSTSFIYLFYIASSIPFFFAGISLALVYMALPQEISKQMMIVEDRPGLYFGSNPERTIYPVLVMIKNSPFTQTTSN